MKQTRNISGQTIAGTVVILVGLLLLLDQISVLDFGDIFRFFPLLFIGLAVWQIIQNGRAHITGPLITIGIFVIIQLALLNVIDGGLVANLWPVVLILVGGSILLRQRKGGNQPSVGYTSARFDTFAMFGAGERLVTSHAFEGGNATAIFGGVEVDLTNAQVEDKPAVINVFAMFGGVVIKASDDMLVGNDVFALFGGTGDERKQRKALAGEQPDVVIRGTVMFGGVSIEGE